MRRVAADDFNDLIHSYHGTFELFRSNIINVGCQREIFSINSPATPSSGSVNL
jgi:hypothetical protein